jgi:EAL domain-containing protein (putative c-di-GMP-specific phosphodiesterase class I)
LRVLFQPIVNVARGIIVGYEALSRFSPVGSGAGVGGAAGLTGAAGGSDLGPREWFAAARAHGVGPDLEAAALTAALSRRRDLPPSCFLSVNISADMIAHPVVRSVLDDARDLRGIVLELTEPPQADWYGTIGPVLDHYRGRGAQIALDDVGAGQSKLARVMSLRPSIIKLDRSVVMDIDADDDRRAIVAALGHEVGSIDAALVAEGVERFGELQTLSQLGVSMAQGFLLGHPGARWGKVPPPVLRQLRQLRISEDVAVAPAVDGISFGTEMLPDSARLPVAPGHPTLGSLLETAPSARGLEEARALLARDHDLEEVVLGDEDDRPSWLVTRDTGSLPIGARVMALTIATEVPEAANRAMSRDRSTRFQPIVCTDALGRYAGIVRLERLIKRLSGR